MRILLGCGVQWVFGIAARSRSRVIGTNVVLYLLGDDPKAEMAECEVCAGGIVSVQVLDEVLANSSASRG